MESSTDFLKPFVRMQKFTSMNGFTLRVGQEIKTKFGKGTITAIICDRPHQYMSKEWNPSIWVKIEEGLHSGKEISLSMFDILSLKNIQKDNSPLFDSAKKIVKPSKDGHY